MTSSHSLLSWKGSTESEMIFHLEDDVQLLASNEPGASMAKVNQQIRQIPPPPPSNQGLLRTAGDKAKLYVREKKVVNIFSYEDTRISRLKFCIATSPGTEGETASRYSDSNPFTRFSSWTLLGPSQLFLHQRKHEHSRGNWMMFHSRSIEILMHHSFFVSLLRTVAWADSCSHSSQRYWASYELMSLL